MTLSYPERWTNAHPNLVALRPGDIVKCLGGYCAVVRVGDCNARVLPLGEPKKVTVTTRFGKHWEVTQRAKVEAIAADLPPEAIVERRGKEWLEQFLKAVAPRREVRPVDGAETTTTNDNERNESMPRTKKTETKPRDRRKDRGGLAAEAAATGVDAAPKAKRGRKVRTSKHDGEAKPRKGSLGDIFGFAVTAVLRAMGKAGITSKHAAAILAVRGIKMPEKSLGVQVSYGRLGTRPPAPLTKEQIDELKASTPEPEEAKAE